MKKILIIEDNADNYAVLEDYLEERYELSWAEDGETALTMLAQKPFNLVLLDISLPTMDGVAVLKAIRADEATKNLPVIALTAHAMRGDKERYLAQGFDGYLSKPIVDDEALIEAIENQLER